LSIPLFNLSVILSLPLIIVDEVHSQDKAPTYPETGKKATANKITGAAGADGSLSVIIKWRIGDAFLG
jgi:hypothetical protein